MGVNMKFGFRRDRKFYCDLSNAISNGNWFFRWDCVFSGGTLYPTANYENLVLMKKFLGWTSSKIPAVCQV